MAATYYERELPGSWAHAHLRMRFGQDLAGDERFRPGYAPAGWTNLVTHLRGRGVSAEEMLAAGLAKIASTGRLIDRFRDRVMLPVISNGQVLGFVGRCHPDAPNNSETDASETGASKSGDSKAGPKYLNTPTTVAFGKERSCIESPTLRWWPGRSLSSSKGPWMPSPSPSQPGEPMSGLPRWERR